MYNSVVNLGEWEVRLENRLGGPAPSIWDYLATFDIRQSDSAIGYINSHARSDKPFFMSINFMKMHNPNPAPQFRGRTKLGNYSDSMLELITTSAGLWMPSARWHPTPSSSSRQTTVPGRAYPDAGTGPFRGMKGTGFEAASGCRGVMWWPGKISAARSTTK